LRLFRNSAANLGALPVTERKVTYALKKIQQCREQGCTLEALVRSYSLNIELIRFVLSTLSPTYNAKEKKVKPMVRDFIREITEHPEYKSVIQKRSLKSVKPWVDKMDGFYKSLKAGLPVQPEKLQAETDRIFGILNLSASKLFIRSRPAR
jgi:hypothetical protein